MKALLFLYCGAVASTLISGQTLEVSNSSISNRTIADVIIRKDNLKTLEAVLSATGLLSSLATPGLNATLFAPSDKAFARLPAGQLDMLMKNATLMEQVLFCKCVVSCLLSVAGAHLGHRHDAMRWNVCAVPAVVTHESICLYSPDHTVPSKTLVLNGTDPDISYRSKEGTSLFLDTFCNKALRCDTTINGAGLVQTNIVASSK
jgi:hypothetical protein